MQKRFAIWFFILFEVSYTYDFRIKYCHDTCITFSFLFLLLLLYLPLLFLFLLLILILPLLLFHSLLLF